MPKRNKFAKQCLEIMQKWWKKNTSVRQTLLDACKL